MMSAIILAYQNPDLDGVACALALEVLEAPNWSARVLGTIDEETEGVLNSLHLPRPLSLESWHGVERVWLVDTHHPNQLPSDMPERLVVRITDHHPGGDPKRYPNAEFQNELVGAAATLVAERYVKNGVRVSGTIAQLLQAAIISNTLNFLAPATSERDKRAFAELRSVSPLPDEIVLRMKAARSGILRLSTMAVLVRDNKSFKRTDGSRVAIGQLEADGALTLLERKDLVPSLVAFGESQHASAVVLNLVDTGVQKSAIVTTDRSLSVVLSQRLNVPMDHDGVIRCDRVLQRKTDIVPYVIE